MFHCRFYIPLMLFSLNISLLFASGSNNGRESYHSSAEIISEMNRLENDYPQICKVFEYGKSVNGTTLEALKISDNVDVDEDEAEVLIDAGIHGNEITAAENAIRFAIDLCERYDSGNKGETFIDDREIWLYCNVNPDGRDRDTRVNANGIDMNRNWGYMWNGEGGSSIGCSEPEVKALRECLLTNQFVLHLTFHSGMEGIVYPWCYTSQKSPDNNIFQEISNIYKKNSGYNYFSIEQSFDSYPTTGETDDYSYGVNGTICITVELSSNKHPATSEILSYYNKNVDAMLAIIEYSGYGISGKVVDYETKEPVAATIFIDNHFPFYSDPFIGDYHKYLPAGTYEMIVTASGYEPDTIRNIAILDKNSKEITVELKRKLNFNVLWGYKCIYTTKGCSNYSYYALGETDGRSFDLNSNATVVIDMQQSIPAEQSSDIVIHTTDNNGNYSILVGSSKDGDWYEIGSASGTKTFSLNNISSDSVRYVKIKGRCSLDAVESSIDKSELKTTAEKSDKTLQFKITENGLFFPKQQKAVSVGIYSFNGRKLFSSNVINCSQVLFPKLSNGLYIAVVKSENGFRKITFIK